MRDDDPSVGELVSRVAFAVGEQAGLHMELQVQLVRAELSDKVGSARADAATWLRSAAPVVLGGVLVGLGYLCACLAVVLGLAPWITPAGGVAVVAVFNLALGGVALRRRPRASPLDKDAPHARS